MSNEASGKPEKTIKKTTPAKQSKTPTRAKTVTKKQPTTTAAENGAAPAKPVLLSGGNPQIAKGDGGAPVQA